jgi:GNAT superfamily N-acetyltransferase
LPYDIRALTPDLLDAYLSFFDGDAFADNPRWKFCYCNFVHYDHDNGPPFSGIAPEVNRAIVAERICARKMHGYLAFAGERPVAWVQAAPRSAIGGLDDEPDPEGLARDIGSIVCFVVAKPHRGKGLAKLLLAAACDGFKAQGLAYADAYPRADAQTEAANHFGPLAMYLNFGFTRYREDPDGKVVVRRALG